MAAADLVHAEGVYVSLGGMPILRDVHVDVAGVRVAGRVRLQEGRLVGVEFSRLQARHRLGAWAPLVLAAAAGVDVAGALLVGRGGSFALDAPPCNKSSALKS